MMNTKIAMNFGSSYLIYACKIIECEARRMTNLIISFIPIRILKSVLKIGPWDISYRATTTKRIVSYVCIKVW